MQDGYSKLWKKILNELQITYDPDTFNELFLPLTAIDYIDEDRLYIAVENNLALKRINKLYKQNINSLVKKFASFECEILFISSEELKKMNLTTESLLSSKNLDNENFGLSPSFKFETFFVCKSNQFAAAMAKQVVETPAYSSNPLYIFGKPGLGKTHLMQAIGHAFLEKYPDKKVLYLKTDLFIEEYVNALTILDQSVKKGQLSKLMIKLQEKCRNCDLLLVDDIQTISNADKTQLEFFKYFDYHLNQNHQIIITSDRPIYELKGIMQRLTTRFEAGLIVDIAPPNLDERISLLKYKLTLNYPSVKIVADDVLHFIAGSFDENVRQLQGALHRFVFYCEINHLNFTLNDAQEALQNVIKKTSSPKSTKRSNFRVLQDIVCDYYKITHVDLVSKKRSQTIIIARHLAMYLLRSNYNLQYKIIGELFQRDHTTVLAAVEKIELERKKDVTLDQAINTLNRKISAKSNVVNKVNN